jgi:disulfide bond formation protein DsbB
MTRSPAALLLVVAVLCFGAVGAALVSQYKFGMLPCPWCTFQRFIFIAIGLVALVGALIPARVLQRILGFVGFIGAAAGVASALWQHFVAAKSDSCNLTLADKIMDGLGLFNLAPDIFTPQASCADAAVSIAGIPYEFFSLALFVIVGLACARAAFGSAR